jgi:dienelactone hydrolase
MGKAILYPVVAGLALLAGSAALADEIILRKGKLEGVLVKTENNVAYNVDLNRVYLTGHSMGGIGVWHLGPKLAEHWAAIAPLAGHGFNRLAWLRKTLTPVYIHHGEDDPVVTDVLLRKLKDDEYGPARAEAHKSLGECVVAFIESFAALGDKRGLDMIDRLAREHGALAGVKQAASRAREKLE